MTTILIWTLSSIAIGSMIAALKIHSRYRRLEMMYEKLLNKTADQVFQKMIGDELYKEFQRAKSIYEKIGEYE